jgi:hypothetical protein
MVMIPCCRAVQRTPRMSESGTENSLLSNICVCVCVFLIYLFCMLHYYAVTLHAMLFLTLPPYNYIISSYTTYTMCKAAVLTAVDDIVLYNLSKAILLVNFFKALIVFSDEFIFTHRPVF